MNNYINVTDFTCNGKCSCCGDILHLSKNEIKKIDEYLKKHKVEETKRCILVDYDNTCPFRDNENRKCKIYSVRPDICRVYQCNRTPEEVVQNRQMNNKGKLPRSMRNLFFNDNKGASWILNILGMPIYNRKDEIIK